jgi:hypothetical protein
MNASNVKEFDFIRCEPETLSLVPGEYKLEVWGASGGTFKSFGGPGGYAKGILTLNEETTVFVRVGSQGSNEAEGIGSQGCNGGGYSGVGGRSGGGATDIRLNYDSLYSRILVAGGGGGATNRPEQHGGFGGGISGGNGEKAANKAGKGAGQSEETLTCADGNAVNCPKGIFGFGGSTSGNAAGGGGGGWFGGSASHKDEGGGGGSGYALTNSSFKPSSYLMDPKYYLKDVVLLGGDELIPVPIGVGNVTRRRGNGYARITPLKIFPLPPPAPSVLDFSFHGNDIEIKDELRKFVFITPGNYSSKASAGKYQFNSTGAFCGTSIVAEYELERSEAMNVSIQQNASIYINNKLLLNVPSAKQETDGFVFPGMKIYQMYNASEFHCRSTNYATMSITYTPPIHKIRTYKQRYVTPIFLF